jgi:hypothetical protein
MRRVAAAKSLIVGPDMLLRLERRGLIHPLRVLPAADRLVPLVFRLLPALDAGGRADGGGICLGLGSRVESAA